MRTVGMIAAAVMGATLLAAGPAFSDPKGCPPGLEKKGWCDDRGWSSRDRDWDDRREWRRDRRDRRDRWEDAQERAYEEGFRDGVRRAYNVGDRLPRDFRVVPDFDRFGWPVPGDGRGYVQYDERTYLVNLATGLILDILSR